jgi:glutathione synthase/RimK-type ligase-like ATP-grasp enzyme
MSPHMSAPRLVVVGNPDNRRLTLFADAAQAAGIAEPRVISWLDVLHGDFAFQAGETVRVDSPGEDAEVARLLRAHPQPVDMYRVEGTRAWYEGFVSALDVIRAAAEKAGARLLADPADVAVAFDKTLTHRRLTESGVPVPALIGTFEDYAGLKRALDDGRHARAFLKIRHGSSASGVVALMRAGVRIRAVTSAELVRSDVGIELYNSLRLSVYEREQDVADLVDVLAADGLHAEVWLPKARQAGRDCDLRIVTVAGRATHAVLRTSPHPMTNLHLGGQRGDLAAFRHEIGAERWQSILDLAERAAACFPRTHVLGIDVLPGAHGRDHIGEVNAYGDLLPNLLGLPGTTGEGTDTYGAQIRSLLHPDGNP